MLIPSIDLQGGQIVQLVQGERLAVASDDVDGWVRKFERFPKIQLIDLDAAKNAGDNRALVSSICGRLPCRVGGGIRSLERAAAAFESGARKVIVGSSLFRGGQPDVEFAAALAARFGPERLIALGKGRDQAKNSRTSTQPAPPGPDATPRERMRHRLHTPDGARLYKRRGATVEPGIGNLKKILDRFSRRGLTAATSELHLAATAFNLGKIHRAAHC